MLGRIPRGRRALAMALAACAAVAASACAAQASAARSTPAAVAAPRHIQTNSVSFPISPASDPSAPGITSVTVSNDDQGKLTFSIAIPNRPALTADIDLTIFLDTDQNASTGNTDFDGADYLIDLSGNSVDLAKWNGSDYTFGGSPASLVYSYSSGATISVNASDIVPGMTGFNFYVAAISGIGGTSDNPDFTNAHVDFAPASGHGTFNYSIKITPLQISAAGLKTSAAKAGQAFTASLAVTSTQPSALAGATVACTAKVAGKALAAKASSISNGKAVCTWQLPKTAKGKKLTGSVTVSVQGLHAGKAFSATVR